MQRINKLSKQIASSNSYALLLMLLLAVFSALLFFRIAPNFLEHPGLVFARMAYSISLPLDQVEAGTLSLMDWFTSTRADIGLIQFSFLGPVALIYSFFGAGGSSLMILPFFFHFSTAICLFAIANELFDQKGAGILAAVLWAAFPATSFINSAFPLTATFVFLSVLACLAIIKYIRRQSLIFLAISLATIAWLFLLWPALALSLIAFGIYAFLEERQRIPARTKTILIAVALLAIFFIPFLSTAIRSFIDQLYQSPGFIIYFLLFLVAFIASASTAQSKAKHIANLFVFSMLAFMAYEYLPPVENMISANIGGFPILLFAVPAILLIAKSLATWIPEKHYSWASLIALVSGLIFAQYADLGYYQQGDLFVADIFMSVSRLSAGFLILALLFFLFFKMLSDKPISAQFGVLWVLLLPIASIFPLSAANYENASTNSSYQRAATLAQSMAASDPEIKIYVCSRRLRDRFWYMADFSDFELSSISQNRNPFLKPPTDISNRNSGIAIIDRECSEIDDEVYDQWNLMFTFGEKDSQLDFYRILP
jgi:hypothetical protein